MKFQLLTLGAIGPLAAYALPKCGGGRPPPQSAAGNGTYTAVPAYPSSAEATSYTSLTSSSLSQEVDSTSVLPATTTIIESSSSSVAVPTTSSLITSASENAPTTTPTTAAAPTTSETAQAASSTDTSPSQVISASYTEATPISFKVSATEQCGDNDVLSLPGMPWTVANSMYNADQMVGSQCTNFEGILEAADGTQEVSWTSITDIDFVESTKDLCKGYTNIGIGVNLNQRFSDISSIPAYFQWDRTNTTEFRGSNLFDFITAPTKGDHDSTATSEFMLWIRIWGGQVPIGYVDGPVATFDLFGASWKLYEGQNPNNGVTVRSLLVDDNFEGEFQGDLKEWLDAMAQRGYIADSDYVTVGNAGTEVFYGSATMSAKVALNIEV
ncbi:hypothetical protein PFICI_15205 [Pestalotiopsis fici W106-1]|uniref:GH16 domain-containing protein n=1 Tax=Pestalotiopsis fici (strain W106-1 / CGMCC3.15140) TaxID=1229662 RepID=W3WGH8_PESFW|nr:uncharacterized protein PFICI_15205 [Pestalotiopsis fici W106-1]ETS73030.1 hypothetical protein PFICI_15205 [Pestalotiopsis fici W106-1]